jgi:hypothetical protein
VNESIEPLSASGAERVKMREAIGLQASGPDGAVKGVRVTDAGGQRLSADIRDDGSVWLRIEGTAIPGRLDEVPACKILVDRFNAERRTLAEAQARRGGREDGVYVLTERIDGGAPLMFQVTRLDPDTTLWEDLEHTGVAEKVYPSADAVADAFRDAIRKKCLKAPFPLTSMPCLTLSRPRGSPSSSLRT